VHVEEGSDEEEGVSRPCPAAHTGEHPTLAQFFLEGSHGYVRVSIFFGFFCSIQVDGVTLVTWSSMGTAT
jgi:hypothetical protein